MLISKNRDMLTSAVSGDIDLRRADPRLWKKLHKLYKREGLILTGDTEVDYNLIMECLHGDLYYYHES